MISSCPVELPKRLGWLKSGRFIRLVSVVAALALLAGVLYNAIAVDRIPPTYQIKVSSPAGGGVVTTLTSIDVEFSKAVRHPTAEAAFSMTEMTSGSPAVVGTFHWQGLKMIFTPSAKLPLSTKFHVRVASGVQDLAGNVQSGSADLYVTTVGAPTVVSVSPADGASSVDVGSSILITFDRLMDTQKVIAGLTLQPDITYQASWNGTILTLSPTRPMAYGTTYTVRIGDPAVDTDGTKLPPFVASFKTVDAGLRVASLVPAPNSAGVSIYSQIAVMFAEPIDPSSIAGAIKLTPPVSGSIAAITLPDDTAPTANPTASETAATTSSPTPAASGTAAVPGPNVLVFTPDNPLAAHTTYSVTLSSTVKRTDGQVSSGDTWSFITGEAPTNALNQIAFLSARSGVDNVWLMNYDGSNQREVTSELVPVSGYDISGDGLTIVYSAAGIVKKMSISGDSTTTLTSGGNFEYAPTITPDGTGVVVGRRDASGQDMGYWRYSFVSGTDTRQITPDGAPGLGSVSLGSESLIGTQGMSSWAGRAAFTPDGTSMLMVRGSDNAVELVDMTGANQPDVLDLQGTSRPVWVQADNAFYVTASADHGVTWALWSITTSGSATIVSPAWSDIASTGSSLALIVKGGDGSNHLEFLATPDGPATMLTDDPVYSESGPSFSPDGGIVVFARTSSSTPNIPAGIWAINTDGTGLTNLSTDGAYPRWLP